MALKRLAQVMALNVWNVNVRTSLAEFWEINQTHIRINIFLRPKHLQDNYVLWEIPEDMSFTETIKKSWMNGTITSLRSS